MAVATSWGEPQTPYVLSVVADSLPQPTEHILGGGAAASKPSPPGDVATAMDIVQKLLDIPCRLCYLWFRNTKIRIMYLINFSL